MNREQRKYILERIERITQRKRDELDILAKRAEKHVGARTTRASLSSTVRRQ